MSRTDLSGAEADLILYRGKVLTVDTAFSIHEAMAVQGTKVLEVGTSEEVFKLRAEKT